SPAANLDVAGNVKIADGTQGTGKVLTSDANGLASWNNTLFSANGPSSYATAYLLATGGGSVSWNNNAGWADSGTIPLILNESSDPHNVYDPTTGTITINEAGAYYIRGNLSFQNPPAATPGFDGTAGSFDLIITVTPSAGGSARVVSDNRMVVYRGTNNFISFPIAGYPPYSLSVESIIVAYPGDKINLAYYTTGAKSMNNNNTYPIVDRALPTSILVYKL
ncbi:hypothetical protein SAMN05880574_107110, partial [Chryseobacterium sp. RU37D]